MSDLKECTKEELVAIVEGLQKGRSIEEVMEVFVPHKEAMNICALHYLMCEMSHAPGSNCSFYTEETDVPYPWDQPVHRKWHSKYKNIFGDTTLLEVTALINTFKGLLTILSDDTYPIMISLLREKYSPTD
jgi:hypothetical protein